MYCKNCGQQIADDAKFCDNCGRLTEEQPQIVQNPMQGKRPIPPGAKLCRYCQALIPRNAKVCPYCHNTLKKGTSAATILLAVIIVVAGFCILPNIIDGFNKAKVEDAIQQEPAISITASELIAAYDENEVAADGKYKNKNLEVTGTIASIGSGINDPYIVLRDGDSYIGIQCYFENQSGLANLKKGDQITIKGIGKGKLLNVNVEKCKIIS